jgi:hypothetical protein
MTAIKIRKLTKTKLALMLLALNIIGGFIWLFGFHTERLLILAFSGIFLLYFMFIQKSSNLRNG